MEFAFFDVVLALAALWLLTAFLTLRCRLPAALAPLAGLAIYSTALTFGGIFGLLAPTAWALYLASAGLGVWALAVSKKKAEPLGAAGGAARAKGLAVRLLTPGAAAFWGMAAGFAVLLAVRRPLFASYDEFSLWGTAAKLTREQNVLFSDAAFSWPWPATQNPGLIVLSYFFQYFGTFAAWKVHLSYDLLLCACFAAVLGTLEWKHYVLAFPAAAACWLTPYVFTVAERQIYVSHVYMLAYADIPAGIVFGGTLAFWLALRRAKGPYWAVLPVLMLAANIKSNTFVLSLAAAGVIAADLLLFGEKAAPTENGLRRRARFARRAAGALGAFAAPLSIYYAWNVVHVAAVVRRSAAGGGLGDTTEQSLTQLAFGGLRLLLGLPAGAYYEERRARYQAMESALVQAFFHRRVTMLGTGAATAAFLLVLLAGALVCAPGRRSRVRAGVLWALSALCFAAYQFMMLLSYAFVFNDVTGAGLVDYNRYFDSYYLGWFLFTLALVCAVLQEAAPARRLLGSAAVLALCGLFWVGFLHYVGPELSILGYADSEFASAEIAEAETARVVSAIGGDPARQGDTNAQRLFLVCQGDDGSRWFEYSYDLLPLTLAYGDKDVGGGGGIYGLPELYDGTTYYHPYSQGELTDYLTRNCDYVFVAQSDAVFLASYGSLFSDGLAAAQDGQALYRVTEDGMVLVSGFEVLR